GGLWISRGSSYEAASYTSTTDADGAGRFTPSRTRRVKVAALAYNRDVAADERSGSSPEESAGRLPPTGILTPRREVRRRWWRWVLVAALVPFAATVALRAPWSIVAGAVGLGLDICGVWVLAFAVVAVTDVDLAQIGTDSDVGGEMRRRAMLRARQ